MRYKPDNFFHFSLAKLLNYIVGLPLGLLEVSESDIVDKEGDMLLKLVFDGDFDKEKCEVLVICGNDTSEVGSVASESIIKLAETFDGLDKLWLIITIKENLTLGLNKIFVK